MDAELPFPPSRGRDLRCNRLLAPKRQGLRLRQLPVPIPPRLFCRTLNARGNTKVCLFAPSLGPPCATIKESNLMAKFCKAFKRLQARRNAYTEIKEKTGRNGGLAYKMPGSMKK